MEEKPSARMHAFVQEVPVVELAPIQAALPDEIMLLVFDVLPAYQLGPVACVCRHWRALIEVRARRDPSL
jgi:hypothetical protein